MICEKCRKDCAHGGDYGFYHGVRQVRHSRDRILNTVRTTTWFLKGRGSAWICDRCVNLRFALRVTFLLSVLGVVSYFLYQAYSQAFATAQITTLAFCLIALGLALVIAPPCSRREAAELVAIGLNKKTLRREGSKAFLTDTRYRSLEKKNRL